MSKIHHNQIQIRMLEKVAPSVCVSDVQNHPPSEKKNVLLSRCVAASALCALVDLEYSTAGEAIVDGPKDNGLDFIYYDSSTRTLYLGQSKWSHAHASSIESGDILKFLAGVQDLCSLKKSKFNKKVVSKWAEISDALGKLSNICLVIAYVGSGKIDDASLERINDFISAQNDTSDLFYFRAIAQKELFEHFVREAAPARINLTITLTHYGSIDQPLRAIYGQLLAMDVAKWYKNYGNHLFSRNIRHFLGEKSDVNSAIANTLMESPEYFWYYNNGVTIIVDELRKQAIGGSEKSVGLFDCKNVTIVNGAQTVGTIGRSLGDKQSIASIPARIIVVQDSEKSIGNIITRASNTQNKIDARNFVALDPEQDRIRTELLIQRIHYEFREGELLENPQDGFEFIEAIISLACNHDDISFSTLSKRYIGGLYDDITTTPYKALFNPGTSSNDLWCLVRLSRRFDKFIKAHLSDEKPEHKGISVHGNRFLLHLLMFRFRLKYSLDDCELIPDIELKEITDIKFFRCRKSNFCDIFRILSCPTFQKLNQVQKIERRSS